MQLMGEPAFEIRERFDLAPDELWRRLWNLSAHTRAVPLTRVESDDGAELSEGSTFTARTSLGPVVFDDVMVVRRWQPPRRAVVAKTGRWLRGTIEASVDATPDGSELLWRQRYRVRWLPDALAALPRALVRAGYRRTLRRIVAG